MRQVAFLRAVNVAGHGSVKMADVKAAFEAAGCSNVATFIQSGNVVFTPPRAMTAARAKIERALARLVGRGVDVCWRSAGELAQLVDGQPFGAAVREPGAKLRVTFLARKPAKKAPPPPPSLARQGLEVVGVEGGNVLVVCRSVKGRYAYPNVAVESAFGVPATTRNWGTVVKIAALAAAPLS